jgi:PAS domain S-box-containing protein
MITVLLVDGGPSFSRAAKEFMEIQRDIEVETCDSIEEALSHIESSRFDAIVSGHVGPGLDGVQLLKALRARGLDVPLILITGEGGESMAMEADLNNGADLYLRVDGDQDEQLTRLVGMVRSAVERRSASVAIGPREGHGASVPARTEELLLLQQMMRAGPVGIVTIDGEGRITSVNGVAEEIVAIPRGDLIGTAFDSLSWRICNLDGSPIPEEGMPFAAVSRSGEPLRTLRRTKDPGTGEERILSLETIPLMGKSKELKGVVATLLDVTAAMASEEERRRSSALMNEMLSCTLDTIVKLDEHGRILFVSSAIRDLIGAEPEGLMGLDAEDFVHPDDRDRVKRAFLETLRSQEPLMMRHRLLRADGHITVETYGRMVPGPERGPAFFVGSIRDITSRQMAEDKLWETGSKLRAIIQASPMAIMNLDAYGYISTWNPAAERTFSWNGADSTVPFSFLPKDGTEEADRLKDRMLAGEHLSDVEFKYETSEGQERMVSISSAPILDQSGNLSSIILVASDVTERKGMEDRLRQLNDLLRLINRLLRHDMMNELMVVSGSLEMYQRTGQERFLDTANKAVNRSMDTIKRMRELEAMAASGGSMRLYDLRQTTENVLKGYMIEFDVEGEGSVYADGALPSAIDNIVRNAIMHGKADAIHGKVWEDHDRCYLRIADNGTGIPEEVKRRIFEEGFSYGPSGGTGLGLFLVTKAIARYGGKVLVEDNQPRGAAFLMVFPKA